jgi:hypothetical protein
MTQLRTTTPRARTGFLAVGKRACVDWLLTPNHGRTGTTLAATMRDGRLAYEVEFTEPGPGGARRFEIPADKLRPGGRR